MKITKECFGSKAVAIRPINDKKTELIFNNGMVLVLDEPFKTVELRYAKKGNSHGNGNRSKEQ